MFLLFGCAPDLVARPTSVSAAPARVLLARQDGGTMSVEGEVEGDQWVDVDAGPDERFGFRYRVLSGGEVLYERTTSGPAIVREFLNYYGELTGYDLFELLPGLGEFPITVPLLEGADTVELQLRTEDGYDTLGTYTLGTAPTSGTPEFVVGTEVLHDGGDPEQAVDIVITGDGYTADELDQFAADADAVLAELMDSAPFSTFPELFNVRRVDAVSNESGVSYDCDPTCATRDTAYGTVFPIEVVNRLTGTNYRTTPVFQLYQYQVARALADVPWDTVLVIANTDHDGGMAVHYATAPNGMSDFTATAVHEMGHSFGLLGDEYVVDFCVRTATLGLPENATATPEAPPWAVWVEDGTPLPTPDTGEYAEVVGAFEGAYNCDDLYRPARRCRMLNSGGNKGFCPVCSDALVRRIFAHADPAVGVSVSFGPKGGLVPTGAAVDGAELTWDRNGGPLEGRPAAGDVVTATATFTTDVVRMAPIEERWTWVLEEG